VKRTIYFFIAVAIIAVSAYVMLRIRDNRYRRSVTLIQLNGIGAALGMYYATFQKIPGLKDVPTHSVDIASGEVYRAFFESNAKSTFLVLSPRWEKASDLVDGWHRSYRFQIRPNDASCGCLLVRIWSIGSNGTDENGDGDDVLYKLQLQ
jgi:hypothetical protein